LSIPLFSPPLALCRPFGRSAIASMAAVTVLGGAGFPWWMAAALLRHGGRHREVVGCPPCHRVSTTASTQVADRVMVGRLMSLPADLRPLQWNLVARRRVSSFSLFDGGVRSGGVTLRDGTTTSMVGVGGGVLVPDEGDHLWLVSCAWGTGLHCGGHDIAVSRSSKIAACLCWLRGSAW
jgi:hypothetical protein